MPQVTLTRAYKMMLDPHPRHIARLDEHISDARWMYNWTLRTITAFDRFRQFKSEYLDDKVREVHGAIFYTKSQKRQEFADEQGLKMLSAEASKEFRTAANASKCGPIKASDCIQGMTLAKGETPCVRV